MADQKPPRPGEWQKIDPKGGTIYQRPGPVSNPNLRPQTPTEQQEGRRGGKERGG
jgi:hypothetical protein